jgi:hypothetical protein
MKIQGEGQEEGSCSGELAKDRPRRCAYMTVEMKERR